MFPVSVLYGRGLTNCKPLFATSGDDSDTDYLKLSFSSFHFFNYAFHVNKKSLLKLMKLKNNLQIWRNSV